MKAASKGKKKGTRGTNLDISRLQANLAVLSTRGEHKQKTKTNELWVVGKRWTWDSWLSRSIKHGQNPSRSCRSSVSTPMLQRSNSLLPSLDLDSHRDRGAFAAQIGAPTIWYRDLDPWTQKFTSEWISPSMLRCEKRYCMTLVDQIAGNWSCGMPSVHLMGQLRGV